MIKFNIFTGNLDYIGSQSSGSLNIPILMSDPASPIDGEAWILTTESPSGGDLLFFHGAMPVTTPAFDAFFFSVKTPSGPKRVELT